MGRVCVIGAGYVGLVTGAGLAQLGHRVTCLEVDDCRLDSLRRNRLPIHERGLDDLVARHAASGQLAFTGSYARAIPDAEFVFIAVNTPTIRGGEAADMQYVESAARSIAQHLDHPAILINFTSQVPQLTTPKTTPNPPIHPNPRHANPLQNAY